MPKKAVSLTLDEANVLWLKGRAFGQGNLSAAVDDLITAARAGRWGTPPAVRTVVAAARTLALPLVTRDRDIRASGAVHVIW